MWWYVWLLCGVWEEKAVVGRLERDVGKGAQASPQQKPCRLGRMQAQG